MAKSALKISDTSGGLEKAILVVQDAVIKIDGSVGVIFLGKEKSKQRKSNPLDKGLIPLLDLLSAVDLCNLMNAALTSIPNGKKFDPNSQPPEIAILRAKWYIQKTAFEIQTIIDGYTSSYPDSNSLESKKGFFATMQKVSALADLLVKDIVNSPEINELTQYFPQLNKTRNFIENSIGFFNQYQDYRQIPDEKLKKAKDLIDKIRTYCILIQSMNDPKQLLSLSGSKVNGALQKEFQKIQDQIDISRILPTLKNIQKACVSVIKVCNQLMNYVKFGQLIVRISTLLISIFKKISVFFKALPIPNVFTAVGITTTVSDVHEKIIQEKGVSNFEKRLQQINVLLGLLVYLIKNMIDYVQQVLDKLNIIILNTCQCDRHKSELCGSLEETKKELENVLKTMQDYVTTVENNQKNNNKNNRVGDYTISIITEEVVDDNFKIRRRYGVALNNKGVSVLQSTPTFASDDQIITNEVKQLLRSKGLITEKGSVYTPEQEATIIDASNYLVDADINWESQEIYQVDLDSPDNENEDEGLGLNAFINKLKGGKKLRKKMREKVAKNTGQLSADMKKMDPSGKYSSSTPGSNLASKLGGNDTGNSSSSDQSTSTTTTQKQKYNIKIYSKSLVKLKVKDIDVEGTSEQEVLSIVEKLYPPKLFKYVVTKK